VKEHIDMRIPARPFVSWRRLAATGAVLAMTAAGAAAMWSGLPSRPIEWNDLNGRLALGQTGAEITPDGPRTAGTWLSHSAASGPRADLSWLQNVAPALSSGLPAPKADSGPRGSANWWGASRKSELSSTSGRSGMGLGSGKGSGGSMGSGGVASAAKKPATTPAPKAAKANGNGNGNGNRSGGSSGSSGSSGFSSQQTPIGALVPGVVVADAATGGMDLAGSGGFGGGDPMAPTPEPSSLLLIGTGILGAAGILRKRLG
jgi:hypothetical protein